jgi:hypothetical protein
VELLRSNQSINTTPPLEPSPESQRSKSNEIFRTGSLRSVSQLSSHSESKGRNVLRKKSIRLAEERQRERYKQQQEELRRQWHQLTPVTPVVPPQHRRSKSHDILGMSKQRSLETLGPHVRSHSTNALSGFQTPDRRPATSSRVPPSYGHYPKSSQFGNPTLHSRNASSVRSLPLSPVSPTYSSRAGPDPFTRPLTRSSFRNFSTPLSPIAPAPEPIIELSSFPETEAAPALRPLSSYNGQGSWLSRRLESRAARRAEKAAHKEALANKKRKAESQEAKQRGIGLDLFCADCQTVVRTVPAYKRGSCFMWWASVALFCLGPLGLIPICLCLIPCTGGFESNSGNRHSHGPGMQPSSNTDSGHSSSRYEKSRGHRPDDEGCMSGSSTFKREVMDVQGCCPLCSSVLSEFCRRRGELRVFTWAGMLGEGETGVARERSVRTVRSARGPIAAASAARRTTVEVPGGRI